MRARAMLREALHEAGLDDLAEDALLLASELCENAVLHAGTEFELLLDVVGPELTVTVIDHGPIAMEIHRSRPRPVTEGIPEHGRGLVLIDAIASAWGTRHDAAGHQVWFTLGLGSPDDPDSAQAAPDAGPDLDGVAQQAGRGRCANGPTPGWLAGCCTSTTD